jgi:hypothetical protein
MINWVGLVAATGFGQFPDSAILIVKIEVE